MNGLLLLESDDAMTWNAMTGHSTRTMQDYMQPAELPAPVFATHLSGFATTYAVLALLPYSCETSLLSSSIDPCPPAVELLPYHLSFDGDQELHHNEVGTKADADLNMYLSPLCC